MSGQVTNTNLSIPSPVPLDPSLQPDSKIRSLPSHELLTQVSPSTCPLFLPTFPPQTGSLENLLPSVLTLSLASTPQPTAVCVPSEYTPCCHQRPWTRSLPPWSFFSPDPVTPGSVGAPFMAVSTLSPSWAPVPCQTLNRWCQASLSPSHVPYMKCEVTREDGRTESGQVGGEAPGEWTKGGRKVIVQEEGGRGFPFPSEGRSLTGCIRITPGARLKHRF